MNARFLPGYGAVFSAVVSSACCWLPLVLVGVGLSTAGVATNFERFRMAFLVIAAILLGLGFYLNYFRKERCAEGSTCDRPTSRLLRTSRGMLWVSTVLVLVSALFPVYVGALLGTQTIGAEPTSSTTEWTLGIDGMTCPGCEAAVNQSLAEVPGVRRVAASYDDAKALVSVDTNSPPSRMALATAIGRAGYRLVSLNTPQAAAEKTLAGHWVAELEDENGGTIEIVMDLGVVNSRWVGEFDLPAYGVMNYPVEVRSGEGTIELFLTAMATLFTGSIGDDGSLTGIGDSPVQKNVHMTFQRSGPAEFSESFVELEAAADDSSRVEILSNDGAELRLRFNNDSKKTRLLMLLSPT
jgi:copper chaperone CopZ